MLPKKVKLIINFDGTNLAVKSFRNTVGDITAELTSDGVLELVSTGNFKAGLTTCICQPTYGANFEKILVDTESFTPNKIVLAASSNGVPSSAVYKNTTIFIEVEDENTVEVI